MPGFDPKKDVPDLAGKVILITGGTAGVGAGTVVELVRHNPAHILFTGRKAKSAQETIAKAKAAAPDVQVTFVEVDLANLDSVKAAGQKIAADLSRLDVLMCNAGIMAVPAGVSKDGYEIHFATNHLGHALLIYKLLPLLSRTADLEGSDVRIILVTSTAWRGTPPGGIVFDKVKTNQEMAVLGRWLRYGQSKLANMIFARELAARYPKILSFSITPGVVSTGLVTDLGLADKALVYLPSIGKVKTPEEGTHNLLWAVGVSRKEIKRGAFYEPVGRLSTMETKASKDPELGKKLWDWTETELRPWA
ncbi:short-chain dehydrogenase TIC 32, chloroplastic [Achaetomium macrosporum]|uniref:Short-chain dehydrogenase TIC 32, chloroplastic n=1 Tax=Achaetomium macrosporum TaxID=79813 RepID=A0AAN7HAM2_9PEZI|nr:short-chain dehydrogenase TIC 32, chloroplastic [Achaetomium macrosporum]